MPSKGSRLPSAFNYALTTGVTTFLAGVTVSLCTLLGVPVVVAMALLLPLSATTIVFTICRALRDTHSLARTIDGLDYDPYVRMLSQQILYLAEETLDDLRNAAWRSEASFLLYVSNKLEHLGEGDEVLALCVGKAWGLDEVSKYFDDNFRAVRRGASMTRIFVVDGNISDEQARIMDEHARTGATTLVLSRNRLQAVAQTYHLDSEFGFALLGEHEIVVHHGLRGASQQGTVFTSELLVAIHRRIFRELQQIAKPYSPRPGLVLVR